MKVAVNYSLELPTSIIIKKVIPLLERTCYLDKNDEKGRELRKVQDAIRRYCKDWGYVTFVQEYSKYTA